MWFDQGKAKIKEGWDYLRSYSDRVGIGQPHPNPSHNARLTSMYGRELFDGGLLKFGFYGGLSAGVVGSVGYGSYMANRTLESMFPEGGDLSGLGTAALGMGLGAAALAYRPTRNMIFGGTRTLLGGATGALKGGLGLNAGGVMGLMTGAAGAVKGAALAAEKVGRFFLTGRGPNANMLDSWLPFYRTSGKNDFLKYAPNPNILRRLGTLSLIGGAASTAREAAIGHLAAPPPSLYFDGRYMRHMNDMGAHAGYGQKMLGYNSNLNNNDIMSTIARSI
jgi:hypothetical protein